MRHARKLILLMATVAILGLSAEQATACSVCFGNPDSNLTKGVAWGIVSLLGVVMLVLGGIAGFFVYLVRRSASMPEIGASVRPESTQKV